MKKLRNPYNDTDNHNCFACSPTNAHGLCMEFYADGDEVVCEWQPKKQFEGWNNVLHGGVQGVMMDEIASWVLNAIIGTMGVTSNINMRLRKSVYMDKGPVTLRASLKEMQRNIAVIDVKLYDNDKKLCAESEVKYFTFSIEKAIAEYDYPGKEAFYAE